MLYIFNKCIYDDGLRNIRKWGYDIYQFHVLLVISFVLHKTWKMLIIGATN